VVSEDMMTKRSKKLNKEPKRKGKKQTKGANNVEKKKV